MATETETTPTPKIRYEDLPIEDQQRIREDIEGGLIRSNEELRRKLQDDNRKAMEAVLEKMRKDVTPPTVQEIQQNLDQDYVEVAIELPTRKGKISVTLTELPMAIEKKFYKLLTEKLKPKIGELTDLIDPAKLIEGTVEQKLTALQGLLDPTSEILCSLVALIIDPYGDNPSRDAAWVSENIPLWRAWNIIMAQVNVNRVRDFFYSAFRDSSSGRMISKASTR